MVSRRSASWCQLCAIKRSTALTSSTVATCIACKHSAACCRYSSDVPTWSPSTMSFDIAREPKIRSEGYVIILPPGQKGPPRTSREASWDGNRPVPLGLWEQIMNPEHVEDRFGSRAVTLTSSNVSALPSTATKQQTSWIVRLVRIGDISARPGGRTTADHTARRHRTPAARAEVYKLCSNRPRSARA